MTERKPVFHPQPAPKQAKKKKDLRKKKGPLFQWKKKEDKQTRTIRFAPRPAQSIVSFLFFSFFLVMCVVVLMTFGRVDFLSKMALNKQVKPEELVTTINQSLQTTEQLRYEGMKLVDHLFTISHEEEEKKSWEAQLLPFLATGLTPDALGFHTTNVDRIARTVRFIKMETINEKEALYRLYYDVRYTEGETWQHVQLILPVSYEGQEIKLVDMPSVTNLASTKEKNTSVYQENRFLPKGSEVTEEERDKLTEFVQRFFELYVTNDEKLALIANVQGLEKATLETVTIKNVIKLKNGNDYVQGLYTFAFKGGNSLTSQFTLEIKPTHESYFVMNMNGV